MSVHKEKKERKSPLPRSPICISLTPLNKYYVTKKLIGTCKAVYSPAPQSLQLYVKACTILALHADVFRGAHISSLPTNAWSTKNNNMSFLTKACLGG